ncbi:MAG TPA: hypothetical protein VG713_07315 [Pirellulales bacterium]|nr:hypothetical protein [Pirellulales bacterium]
MLNKIDVYTVLLGVSLLAVLMAVLLLALELGRFSAPIPPVARLEASPGSAIARTNMDRFVVNLPA